MTLEENKALVRRYSELWGKDDLSALPQIVAPDVIVDWPGHMKARGVDALARVISGLRRMFPSLVTSLDHVVAEEDQVAVWWTARGVQRGELMAGIPPTGKEISWTGSSLYRIVDGRIASETVNEDFLTLEKEAGLIQETKRG